MYLYLNRNEAHMMQSEPTLLQCNLTPRQNRGTLQQNDFHVLQSKRTLQHRKLPHRKVSLPCSMVSFPEEK